MYKYLPRSSLSIPGSRSTPLSRFSLFPSSLSTPFTTTTPPKMTPLPPQTTSLLRTTQTRRTIYALGKNSPVPDSTINHLITESILHVPSSFNTQSTRLVLLLHDQHERFWDLVIGVFKEELVRKGVVDETTWRERTGPKLGGLRNALGTVCFFSLSFLIYLWAYG